MVDHIISGFPDITNVFISRGAEVSDCGQWLIITPQKDCRDNLLYFCDLDSLLDNKISGKLKLTQVVHKLEADYEVSNCPQYVDGLKSFRSSLQPTRNSGQATVG